MLKVVDSDYFFRYDERVNDHQYLTVQEACRELGLAETTVRTTLSEGRLPFVVKFGRKLIDRTDLDNYRQRTQPSGVKKSGRPRKTQEAQAG